MIKNMTNNLINIKDHPHDFKQSQLSYCGRIMCEIKKRGGLSDTAAISTHGFLNCKNLTQPFLTYEKLHQNSMEACISING